MVAGLGYVIGMLISCVIYICIVNYAYKKSLEEYPYEYILLTDSHGRERIIKVLKMKEQEKLIKELEKKKNRTGGK